MLRFLLLLLWVTKSVARSEMSVLRAAGVEKKNKNKNKRGVTGKYDQRFTCKSTLEKHERRRQRRKRGEREVDEVQNRQRINQ